MGGTTPRCIPACLAFALILSASCGGGGGGGDGGAAATEDPYTGPTTQAVLARDNVNDLLFYPVWAEAMSPYMLSAFVIAPRAGAGLTWPDIMVSLQGASPEPGQPRSGEQAGYPGVPAACSAVTSDTEVMYGDYGGTMTDSWHHDTDTGDFWGELVYRGFSSMPDCYISGTVPYAGLYDARGRELHLVYTYRGFGLVYETSAGMITGEVNGTETRDWDYDLHTGTNVSDLVITNVTSNRTFKVEHATENIRDFGDQEEHVFSMRFYHQDHGYVDFATVEQLLVNGEFIVSGSIMVTGGPGPAGGPTRATFDYSTKLLRLDEDGDGAFEIVVQH